MSKILYSFQKLFFILLSGIFFSQSITKEEFYNQDLPNFNLYDDAYFITGVPLSGPINKHTSDIKYNISFSQLLTKKSVFWDTYIYLAYTQKAFWGIYENSSPFKEINFNPAVIVSKPFWKKDGHLMSIAELKFEHESNGRAGEESRSWNRVTGSYKTNITNRLQAELKVWAPFVTDDNEDLLDYVGYGELTLDYDFIPKVLITELKVRNSLKDDYKGAIRARAFLRFGKRTNQYIMLEYFNGYGENLINYNERTNMIRIGYALKSPWDNLFKSGRR